MFLGGSKLRPELGRPDYSGFANAATIQAESMARIGASIAGAAKDYQDKKELKEANKLFDQMIKGFADSDSVIGRSLQSVGLDDPKTISASRAGLGRKQMLEFINFLTEAEVKSMAQPPALSIKDLAAFKENLDGDLDITPEGLIVDTTLRNEILPRSNPRVQQLLQTDEGRYFLRGYNRLEPVKQTSGNASQDNNIVDLGILTR